MQGATRRMRDGQTLYVRNHITYDPVADAAEKWPEWRFIRSNTGGIPELICPGRRVVLLDADWCERDEAGAFAHALAHLDLGHHESASGRFSTEDEKHANWLAKVRLDREGTR